MDKKKILSMCDHTCLSQTATENDIRRLCEEAIEFNCASVCVPPSYVSFVKENFGEQIKVCTVIGFPNGYSTTQVKCTEAHDAILSGANEIDMVINLGWVKDKKWSNLKYEIDAIKEICGDRILKVIIETCLLSKEEIVAMCAVINETKADFIKTSTGFSRGGATLQDMALINRFREGPIGRKDIKIKASGGISTFEDAQCLLDEGADRLGTSRLIKLMKENTDSAN